MKIRRHALLIQGVVTLIVLSGSWFLWSPPGQYTDLATGIAACLALIAFLSLRGTVREGGATPSWPVIAFLSFALCVGGASNYLYQLSYRTFPSFENPGILEVAGTELTPQAESYQASVGETSAVQLLPKFSYEKTEVWTPTSIANSEVVLALSYLGLVFPLLLMVYTGTEAFSRAVADPFPKLRADLDRMRRAGFRIFFSYRRADAAYVVGRLRSLLEAELGGECVFLDVDSIHAAQDFPEIIDQGISQSNVLMVVIGKEWSKGIERPNDFVKEEILAGLRRNIPVLPVFIEGQSMPDKSQLPVEIQELTDRNGLPLRADPDFDTDASRLLEELVQIWKRERPRSPKSRT
jgi:hypothetical protein